MYLYGGLVCGYQCLLPAEARGMRGAGGNEPANAGAGNQTPFLWKKSTCSSPLSRISSPQPYFQIAMRLVPVRECPCSKEMKALRMVTRNLCWTRGEVSDVGSMNILSAALSLCLGF